MEMAGTWRIIVLLIACLQQSRCQAFGTVSLSWFSAGLPVFKTFSLSVSSSGGGMKQFHDHPFRKWSFQLLDSQHSSSSSIWKKQTLLKLHYFRNLSGNLREGLLWLTAGRHGVNTQTHTCTYMHAILPQPPGKATLCSNQIWEIGLATKSLKVNPMVIIGKSKVKACKTLPYTALFHLLSLHPQHYTHYHISRCCQRETGAGLHAAQNETQWLSPSWQGFNALFQDLINCLGIRQYFALFSTLGQPKPRRFQKTGLITVYLMKKLRQFCLVASDICKHGCLL